MSIEPFSHMSSIHNIFFAMHWRRLNQLICNSMAAALCAFQKHNFLCACECEMQKIGNVLRGAWFQQFK